MAELCPYSYLYSAGSVMVTYAPAPLHPGGRGYACDVSYSLGNRLKAPPEAADTILLRRFLFQDHLLWSSQVDVMRRTGQQTVPICSEDEEVLPLPGTSTFSSYSPQSRPR